MRQQKQRRLTVVMVLHFSTDQVVVIGGNEGVGAVGFNYATRLQNAAARIEHAGHRFLCTHLSLVLRHARPHLLRYGRVLVDKLRLMTAAVPVALMR